MDWRKPYSLPKRNSLADSEPYLEAELRKQPGENRQPLPRFSLAAKRLPGRLRVSASSEGIRSSFRSLAFFLLAVIPAVFLHAADTAASVDSTPSVPSEPPPRLTPTEAELTAWIEQLGSSEFRLREEAAENLSRCHAGCIGTLREAAKKTTDLEVKSRCLLIADAIYDADIGERSRAFLRSSDHALDFGFEAWKPFAEIAGRNRLTKRIFAEFARAYPELADQDLADKVRFIESYNATARNIDLRRRRGLITVIDSVALQFGAIVIGTDIPANQEKLTCDLARSAPYSTVLAQTVYSRSLSQLTSQWALTTIRDADNILQLALEKNIAGIVPKARQVLQRGRPDVTREEFEMAVACLVRFGTVDDLPLLAKWSDDERIHTKTEMRRPQVMILGNRKPDGQESDSVPLPPVLDSQTLREVDVRYQDIAVAGWLVLAGRRDIHDFFPYYQRHYLRVFMIDSLGFTEDEKEKQAAMIEAWKNSAK